MEEAIRQVGERYEAWLLWVAEDMILPDNRKAVLKRFKRIHANSVLEKKVHQGHGGVYFLRGRLEG